MFEGLLWLFPDTALAAWLQSRIDVLCARFGTPRFRAHLTLLGGIGPIDEADAEIRTRELAPRLPPLLLEPTGLHGYDEYFRTLVLDVVDTPALCEARRLAAARFGVPKPAFKPHLSLIYGGITPAMATELASSLSTPWAPEAMATALATSTARGGVPVPAWITGAEAGLRRR